MNQILIGVSLFFIFFSCGSQENSIQEKPQNIVRTSDTLKEVKERKKSSVSSSRIDSVPMDTSIYNQYNKEGKKEGFWKEVDKNGTLLSQGYYKNGRANGWMKWYYKGVLMAEGNMINDKRNGPWIICDVHDSSLCINAYFENESREGVWKIYHDNGTLHKEQIWGNDQPIAEKCWDKKGTPINCE